MTFRENKFILLVFFGLLFFNNSQAQSVTSEEHVKVAMRMIGHNFLLQLDDSTSNILPIIKDKNQYTISFNTTFQFDPSDLIGTIDKVMTKAKINNPYLVEVERCKEREVFYSYEIKNSIAEDLLPCGGRTLEEACYNILITIQDNTLSTAFSTVQKEIDLGNHIPLFLLGFVILIAAFFLFNQFQKKDTSVAQNPITQNHSEFTNINNNKISIGQYEFDAQRMELVFDNSTTELTSKEADLLLFLHQNANEVIEREQILKAVWGDEGDYIGRTLDVFISKLRKRLSADDKVKIMNIRGVGYKLVI